MSTKDVELSIPDDGKKEEDQVNFPVWEHTLEMDAIAKELQADFKKGLTSEEAKIRLERDGPNILTPPEREPWWMKLLGHLVGGFSSLLWAGSILCFIVYGIRLEEGETDVENLTLGTVLAVVVTMTGIFAFYQDMKAEAVLEGFMKMVPTVCMVMRSEEWITVDASTIVKGDIIKVQNGDKVAADCIMLTSMGVKVDNSSLTGEAEPQKRSPGSSDPVAERSRNVAFFGTDCVAGTGTGVVVRIGDQTCVGGIAANTLQKEAPETLMKIEIENFVHIISFIALAIGITFLVISLAMGYDAIDSVVFMIGIIVANVPEGLLATVTVALTITALHMADKQVLVKNVETVETLGAVTAIASDKTGTLTQNRMTVVHAVYNSRGINAIPAGRQHSRTDVLSGGKEASSKIVGEGDDDFAAGVHPISRASGKVSRSAGDFDTLPADLKSLVRVAGLCNHATFKEKNDTRRILDRDTNGDASESALLKFAHAHINIDDLRTKYPEIACVPFNSANKWMATIHRTTTDSGAFKCYTVLVKGAPERVLERCGTHGNGLPVNDTILTDIKAANNEVAENGERVLAFAELELTVKDGFEFETDDIGSLNFKCDGLRFVGLLSLEDPPRPEVPGAVDKCRDAGIRVIMVTGDQPLTARSIAGQVGIINDPKNCPIYDTSDKNKLDPKVNAVVVTGMELDKFKDEDWDYCLSRTDLVFSRTLPHQKQQIVMRLQGKILDSDEPTGHVVAVTGDGVNDAPALKSANVGIAMGTGSQVAKDAADMILMDDNFASIVNGIEEGRLIFANLKKSIAYTLTSNIPEILPFLCMIALRIPLGLTTIMILCIDLGTDMLPAIAFAYELPESNIMTQPPRDRFKEKLVTGQLISFSYLQIGIIQAMAAFTVFFYILEQGVDVDTTSYKGGISSLALLENDAEGLEFGKEQDYDICMAKANSNRFTTKGYCVPATGNNVECDYTYDTGDSQVDGYCLSEDERSSLLQQAQTAFLASIVVCQIGCGIACKTRTNSILSQGMKNTVQNYGIFQEISLIVLLVYVPFLNLAFGTEAFAGEAWVIGAPFALLIVIYDECRKWCFRTYGEEHWIYRWFHF